MPFLVTRTSSTWQANANDSRRSVAIAWKALRWCKVIDNPLNAGMALMRSRLVLPMPIHVISRCLSDDNPITSGTSPVANRRSLKLTFKFVSCEKRDKGHRWRPVVVRRLRCKLSSCKSDSVLSVLKSLLWNRPSGMCKHVNFVRRHKWWPSEARGSASVSSNHLGGNFKD